MRRFWTMKNANDDAELDSADSKEVFNEEKLPVPKTNRHFSGDPESQGRYIALLVAYNSIKEKYIDLQRCLRLARKSSMSQSLNQLDSPTEADQLQMLLEMKTKECEVLMLRVQDFSSMERQYLSEIQSGQENLSYAIQENEKMRSELEQLKGQSIASCERPYYRRSEDEASQVFESRILSRGAIDRSFCIDPSQDQTDGSRDLLRQVEALTLEKKQLMTHVHWLTNELRNKDSRLTDISQMVSQYNGNGTVDELAKTLQSMNRLHNEGRSLEEGTQNFQSKRQIGERQTMDVGTQTIQNASSAESEVLKERVKKIRSQMMTLKASLVDGITLSDSIQQSAVQSVRHPFEPRLYSEASASDFRGCSSRASSDGIASSKRESPIPKVNHPGKIGRSPGGRQSSFSRVSDDVGEDSLCQSVYHSTVASPQDNTDDDADFYDPRVARNSQRRKFLEPNSREDRLLISDRATNCSSTLHGDSLVGAELCGYVARKLQQQQHSDLLHRFERSNPRGDSVERTPMMSLAAFPESRLHFNGVNFGQSRDGSI